MVCCRNYIGSSETALFTRWTGHKSHIKNEKSTCGLTKHFDIDRENHNFIRKDSDMKEFDIVLSTHLRVTAIESIADKNPTTKKLKDREAYWQYQLRTYTEFGGLNERDSRVEISKKSYHSSEL